MYFKTYSSFLFDGSRKVFQTWVVNTMDVALARIKHAFGIKMTYCGVGHALSKMITDVLLNSELQVLLHN